MIIRSEKNEELNNTFSRMFALFLNSLLLVDMVRMLLNGENFIVSIVQYGFYGVTAAYAYYQVLFKQRGKIRKDTAAIVFIIFVSLAISHVVCPNISAVYSYFIPLLIIRIIPALYYASHLDGRSIKGTFIQLQRYVFVWCLYSVIGIVYISIYSVSWGQYASNFGFNLLLPVSFAFYKYIKVKGPIWLLFTAFFSLTIALRGSRTALLCFVIFAGLFYLLSFAGKITTNKVVIISLILVIAVIVSLNYTTIFAWLSSLFPSSRTLSLLVSGFKFDSGRSEIHDIFLNEIRKNPLLFRGIFSDRILYSATRGIEFEISGYPHNIFIEIVFQFGAVLGTMILIPLIYYLVKALKVGFKCLDLELKCMLVLFFTAGIIKLLFSGSYLTTIEFYLCICFVMTSMKLVHNEVDI